MTTYSKSSLKTFFESGDVPQGGDFSNLIDSYINVVETTAQSMAGALITPELTTAYISATNIRITGTLSANNLAINGILLSAGAITGVSLGVSHDVSAGGYITGSAATFNTIVSAASINLTGNVSATSGTGYFSALRAPSGIYGNSITPIVSAAGTSQAAATILTISPIVRGQGTADGATTGFAIPANQTGMMQFFIHEGAVSGNLWPPTGGQINALGANATFALAANTMYTILHKSASAYAVK